MQEASEGNHTSHDVCARWMHPIRVYANNTIFNVGLDMYLLPVCAEGHIILLP
jgi:hypothetical protein